MNSKNASEIKAPVGVIGSGSFGSAIANLLAKNQKVYLHTRNQEVADSIINDMLTDGISKLSERDQIIMALYYTEDMNLKEIGAVLDISESRVSQLLSANVKKLRKIMALSGGRE